MRLLIVGLLLLLSGCAFTVHDVEVDYQYSGPASEGLADYSLTVGDVTDSRTITDTRMLAHQQNTYGMTTSGGWLADRPVSEITRDALIQGLEASGALVGNDAELLLTGEIMSYAFDPIMGFWTVDITGTLTLRLQLIDRTTGQIIWRDSFQGSAQSTHGFVKNEDVVAIFVACLDEVVQKLTTDDYFRQQLRMAGSSSQ